MFKNMESMRQGSHRSPTESLSRRTLTDQILKGHYGEDQSKFSKSVSNTQSLFTKRADVAPSVRDHGGVDHDPRGPLPRFGSEEHVLYLVNEGE